MASNPYVNKVQLADGTSLIDISDTTATADKIVQGVTAYSASGQKITGTIVDGNNLEYGLTDGTQPIVGVAKVGSAEI